MSLLIFLAVAGAWLAFAWFVAKRIPAGLGIKRAPKLLSALLFPLLVVLPFVDEIIGRWQFSRLCEREAVVWLSPDWRNVRRARIVYRTGDSPNSVVLPVEREVGEFLDIDAQRVFGSFTSFSSRGGVLVRSWSKGQRCRPKNIGQIIQQIDPIVERSTP